MQSAMGGGTSQILEDSSDSLSGTVGGSDIQQRSPLQVCLCLHTFDANDGTQAVAHGDLVQVHTQRLNQASSQ